MRKPFLFSTLPLAFLICSVPKDHGQGGRPIPPGVRDADKQINAPIEAPAKSTAKRLDLVVLRQEAEELAKLSAAIPPQMDQVAEGRLPKDLGGQLKRIEKLAKHLRSETVP